MANEITYRTIYQDPPGLVAILDKFKNVQNGSQEGAELLNRIMESKRTYDDGCGPIDERIQIRLQLNGNRDKAGYQEAYIDYMGLTFFYCDAQKYDAAWFYYAKAQHCLGIYDSWDKVLDHLVCMDQERQNRAKGGHLKNHKHTKPLQDALIKIAIEKKPPGGWKNKKELIDTALPTLEAILNKSGHDSFPLFWEIERTALRWLEINAEAREAYIDNSHQSNLDF